MLAGLSLRQFHPMRVYTWRFLGADAGPVPKRPDLPWGANELDTIVADRALTERIFDFLVQPVADQAPGAFRIGHVGTLSPSMGLNRDGLVELSRSSVGDRVNITYIRGFWDELHVIHRAPGEGIARSLCEGLINRSRRASTDAMRPDLRPVGGGKPSTGSQFIYLLTRGRPAIRWRPRVAGDAAAEGELP
ncbi:MAG: hypothetical protein KC620_01460 [Myxococcales bacterium]|nr:hypothetical protein [Myxococcales bacterium]